MANSTETVASGARQGAPVPARDAADHILQQNLGWNRARIIGASALQNAGDQVGKASTVLAWLLASLGAPTWTIGLLVPVRESGSMILQAAMTPWVRGFRQRKWIWVIGGAGQAISVAAMAVTATLATGTAAGVAILIELAVFALSRSLTSISSKDVLGRTIPKGQRGDINGIATLVSGGVAVAIGVGIRLLGGSEVNVGALAALLGVASLAWMAALIVYASVREPAGQPAQNDVDGWASRSWHLLRDDVPFRTFVTVRALLLVSALSPPFIVGLAAEQGDGGLSALGPFVVASGLAGIVGGRPFGRLADRSSRTLMIWGAGIASVVILALLAADVVPALADSQWLLIATYFLLALTHTGVRVARKTYVVDMATGDTRTDYVAVANTTMGVLLLIAGGLSSSLAQFGTDVALLFLAVLGLAGVLVARSLPEVSEGRP